MLKTSPKGTPSSIQTIDEARQEIMGILHRYINGYRGDLTKGWVALAKDFLEKLEKNPEKYPSIKTLRKAITDDVLPNLIVPVKWVLGLKSDSTLHAQLSAAIEQWPENDPVEEMMIRTPQQLWLKTKPASNSPKISSVQIHESPTPSPSPHPASTRPR